MGREKFNSMEEEYKLGTSDRPKTGSGKEGFKKVEDLVDPSTEESFTENKEDDEDEE